MSKIPFPNPHDADSLNSYLDALAAGKQAAPASDVEAAAREFYQLASRAGVSVPKQPIEQERGDMQTATLAVPISNRTRRQMAATEKKPGRSYGWLSAVIVAGLLISMIGSAWLNREPGNPHDQLAFAPGTPEAATFVCPVTLPNHVNAPDGLDHYAAVGQTWFEDGIWISIPTDGTLTFGPDQQFKDPDSKHHGWGFEKLIVLRGEGVEGMVEITGRRLDAQSESRPYNDPRADQYYGETGFVPIALMVPGEGCWEFTATAGDASATWVLNIEFAETAVWTQPISYEECPLEEIEESVTYSTPSALLYSLEDYEDVSTNRIYEVEGMANEGDAISIVSRAREAYACGMQSETLPFWTSRFEYENRTREGQASLDSSIDQRIDDAAQIMAWYEAELGLTEAELIVRVDPNEFGIEEPEHSFQLGPFNPEYAVQLSDGRVASIQSVVIYGDAEYEPSVHQGLTVTIFAQEDGAWMVDEVVPVRFSDQQLASTPGATPWPVEECPYCRPPGN